ncbi:hypothetical protein ACFLUH_02915 [Chloroflexota bacterium]
MSCERTIFWPGITGEEYKYCIYPIGVSFEPVPGNYILARETGPQRWTAIYIGETDNLDELLSNLDNEEIIKCIRLYGGTHIHVHNHSFDSCVRRREVTDISRKCHPLGKSED